MSDMAKCKSCGATMLWTKTPSGRNMPLDPDPVPDGNVILIDGVAFPFHPDHKNPEHNSQPRYKSHFATCAFASQHRKTGA